ncbi:putative leucine-rich repeat-containing protein DDB_G0290503 [Tribolium madens]|uniref:putative leucine-rich repeat-containing protein DDB_G0290503 n=1 Tax=Tribolium madens TaxID=41895 RepID=UPI001CF743F3|nr:putative leucine-rich repeat-containing protein DDB_G0290503 [Tribolium madens]
MELECMEQDENMYMMQFNENYEPQDAMSFNNSVQIPSQENQVVEQGTEQVEEQVEEETQPLYKLQNIDTEASIKNEIKQLILTKAAEEISAKSLEDMRFEVESEITNLRNKTHQLLNKTEALVKEVETDHSRIVQSEEILLKTNQMIELLKKNVEKLQVRQRQSQMIVLMKNSIKQYTNLETLRKLYEAKIEREKKIEALKITGNERILNLKKELNQSQAALEDMRRKYEEFKKNISYYVDEIEKSLTNKNLLEQKLAEIETKKTTIENDFLVEAEKYEALRTKEEDRTDKLNEIKKERIQLEQELEQMVHEIDQIKNDIADDETTVSKKELELKELEEKLNTEQNSFQEISDELQKKSEDMSSRLNEVESAVVSSIENNNNLLNKINTLNDKYSQLCEEKLALTNKILTQQEEMHSANIDLVKKQMENEHKRTKIEEIQNRYETSVTLLKSLENDIKKEKDNANNQLQQAKAKLEFAQAEHDNRSTDMRKKLQYLLVNSNCLKEKCENLQSKVSEEEKTLHNLEEEYNSLEDLKAKKLARRNELKEKLAKLKNAPTAEAPPKSIFKTPSTENVIKQVKFNEMLSFKSATSSDNSSLPVENVPERTGQLNTSFQEWLNNINNESDDTLNKEY